ncbi:transcription repressor OFP13 [Senna tora]|uniref:Transcription repressor n=1 Tax=Senna tora TaxID=362788 RepID=A0A834WIB6_9FABA|nr:transcription repressor OFP13 [Senna tora]
MGKKSLNLPSLFKPHKRHQWPQIIPSCRSSPKTLSFRAGVGDVAARAAGGDIFKTVNSVFFEPSAAAAVEETPDPWFTTSSESAASFTTESDVGDADGEASVETVVRGVRSSAADSERLFFDPDETRSILEASVGSPFEESEVVAMESADPYGDFRNSMAEMVESQGVRDWEGLEELLGWYLRVNGKKNHGFIIGAFVDLLVSLATNHRISSHHHPDSITASSPTSYSSAVSSFSAFSPLLPPSNSSQALNEGLSNYKVLPVLSMLTF